MSDTHSATRVRPVSPAAPATAGAPVKVLFVCGAGRSGSTLLDNVLGQVPGIASMGEVRYVWERGVLHNRLCGCGQPFRECAVWSDVLTAAYGNQLPDASAMVAEQDSYVRLRHLRRLVASRHDAAHQAGSYPASLAPLYRAIAGRTGARVVVDSSKIPPYGYLLAGADGIELSVVHLIRDSRAQAFSWSRTKQLPDPTATRTTMIEQGPLKSTTMWALQNSMASRMFAGHDRYLRVRYEDFVADPEATVRQVLALVDEPVSELPFTSSNTVKLAPTHTVAGNPGRFAQGEVTLRPDDRWRTQMRIRDRALVTAASLPWLLRYRYPLRAGTRPAPTTERSAA